MDIDAVIAALYEVMCYEAGGHPDWDRLATILAPDARLVRVTDDGVFEYNPTTFRSDIERMIESGALPSFWEGELRHSVQQFGDIAHVLSIYEGRSSRNAPVLFRAVKSMQLYQRNGQWWISALLWRREGAGLRIGEEVAITADVQPA